MTVRASGIRRLATALTLATAAGCTQTLAHEESARVLVQAGSSERYAGQIVLAGTDQLVYTEYKVGVPYNLSIRRVSTDGGNGSTLVADAGDVEEITSDGTNVYWMVREQTTFNRTIRAIPVNGGSVTTIASGIAGTVSVLPKCFVTDGASVFFSSDGHGVRSVSVTGGTITDLAPTLIAESCTQSGGFVYYKNGTNLARVSTAGGTPQSVGTGVLLDPQMEFAVVGNLLIGLTYLDLFTVPVTGGDITDRIQGLNDARDLASDGVSLYFNDIQSFSMGRASLSDYFPTKLYSNGLSVGLAIDGAHVYWINNGNQLMRGVK